MIVIMVDNDLYVHNEMYMVIYNYTSFALNVVRRTSLLLTSTTQFLLILRYSPKIDVYFR